MTQLIDQTNKKLQMRYKREHKYDLKPHEEQLYKEVVYDVRAKDLAATEQEYRYTNPLKKMSKGRMRVRNVHEESKRAEEIARAPIHARKQTTVVKTADGHKVADPYDHYRVGPLSAEDERNFEVLESTFRTLMGKKAELTSQMLWRELDYYLPVYRALPILIDKHLYFRNIDNAADCLTLYRHPVHDNTDLGENPRITEETEVVFDLNDIISFYERYAEHDSRIKQFCEKITDRVKVGDH